MDSAAIHSEGCSKRNPRPLLQAQHHALVGLCTARCCAADRAVHSCIVLLAAPHVSADSSLAAILDCPRQCWFWCLDLGSCGQAYPEWVTHFTPNSVIFTEKNRPFVLLSDLGIFLVLGIIGLCAHRYGALNVFMYYGVPYLVVNFWLVAITFLQHTDPIIAHYRGEEWSFLRGALSTIDRDYGIFNHFHHHIGDTHVVHHLFSTLPHYHAEEATEAIKEFLGKYYSYDSRPILEALYSNFIVCKFVEDEGDVVFYKH
ncbi:hypothetical protein BSLG_008963 [Batrachochytrium salamandrivorans]|nr:hypothetical protein BSLG_008963 [Batrachochytrium salamandrivorans]